MSAEHYSEPTEPKKIWEGIDWQPSPYNGVFISMVQEVADPDNPSVPHKSVIAVKVEPGATLPIHWHKRGSEWLEKIDVNKGESTILGFSEEELSGPITIYNDYLEMFGIRNESPTKPLYMLSTMIPGYTGSEENKKMDEWY
jgi:hypothetical protein